MQPEVSGNSEHAALDVLDSLLAYLDDCPRFPPGYPVILADRERLLEFALELQESWQDPIGEARAVEEQLEEVIAQAHARAEERETRADACAAEMVRGHPLTTRAARLGAEIARRTEVRSAALLRTGEESAAEDLRRIEDEAERMLAEVRRGERVLEGRLSGGHLEAG